MQSLASIQSQYNDIAAIDYFFAKAMLEHASLVSEESQNARLFALLMALSWAQRQGHSCLPLAKIASHQLWQDRSADKQGYQFSDVQTLEQDAQELIKQLPTPKALHFENNCLYTMRSFKFEQDLITGIREKRLQVEQTREVSKSLKGHWARLFPSINDKSTIDWQAIAVALATQSSFFVINGGPGTGKTYTMARLMVALQLNVEAPLNIGLCAPTGKAAQRLSESLQRNFTQLSALPELAVCIEKLPTQAMTLHRLLGLREGEVETRYGIHRSLPYDVVIVDECSMLDLALFTRLMRAVAPTTQLILVGDANQLPAVELGAVFPNVIPPSSNELSDNQIGRIKSLGIYWPDSDSQKTAESYAVELVQTQRFSGELQQFAEHIHAACGNPSNAESAWRYLVEHNNKTSLQLCAYQDFESQLQEWVEQYYVAIALATSPEEALTLAARFRVLTPLRAGQFGAEVLNQKIEIAIKKRLKVATNTPFYHGQMIINLQNLPALGLFNGDVGVVWQQASGQLLFCFPSGKDGSLIQVDSYRISSVMSVYAMTIHKSQGSEFEHVGVVIPPVGGEVLLNNPLLYTAVTRSKRLVSVVADQSRFCQAITTPIDRWTGISPDRLIVD